VGDNLAILGFGKRSLQKLNFFFFYKRAKTLYDDKWWPPFLSCFKNLCASVFCETAGCFFGFADLWAPLVPPKGASQRPNNCLQAESPAKGGKKASTEKKKKGFKTPSFLKRGKKEKTKKGGEEEEEE